MNGMMVEEVRDFTVGRLKLLKKVRTKGMQDTDRAEIKGMKKAYKEIILTVSGYMAKNRKYFSKEEIERTKRKAR